MSIGHTVAGVDDSGGMARDSKLSQQRASISTDKRSLNNDSGPTSGDLEVDTEKALHPSEASLDPNVVNWDGPHDPANPLNWAKPTRLGQVVIISIITLVAYVFLLFNQRQAHSFLTEIWLPRYLPPELA